MQRYELLLDKFIDHAAKWHPRVEVVTGAGGEVQGARVSYAELRTNANRLSGAFAALGLQRGDRIATLAWNSQAHMECWYAAMGVGIAVHTLNPRIGADHLIAMTRAAHDRALFASPGQLALAREIAAACPQIEHIVLVDEPGSDAVTAGSGIHSLASLVAELGAPAVWGGFAEETEAGLCFTSGTTGAPKGVTYTHRSNYLETQMLIQADVMGLGARDSILAAVPMFHANGWGLPFAAPATGAKLVLPGRHLDGASIAHLIASESVTVAFGVATVWIGLLEHLDTIGGAAGGMLPSLERVILGGSSVPQALMDRIEQRLGVRVQTSWGMTELSPLGTLMSPHETVRRATVCGRPPVGVDLLLTDADGVALPQQRGATGHLRVRGMAVVERYLGHGETALDADGWFDTGDLAIIDDGGFLTITGRAKDLIKSGGEWINPGEIEAILGALPAVGLVAVIGRTDAKWTERPIAIIELHPDHVLTDDAIHDVLRGRIPRWWMLDAIERVDRMPLAATGKIDKLALRKAFGQPLLS